MKSKSSPIITDQLVNGKLHFDDGVYEGQYLKKARIRHGYGILTHKNGDTYTGQWVFDQTHGFGKYEWRDSPESHPKQTYEGMWKDGMRHGDGICIFHANNNKYIGEWVADQMCGAGTMIFEQDSKDPKRAKEIYEGMWRDSKFHGRGKITKANGNQYEGDFVMNRKHGWGVLDYVNLANEVCRYEGCFENDQKHGWGVLHKSNTMFSGVWQYNSRGGWGQLKTFDAPFDAFDAANRVCLSCSEGEFVGNDIVGDVTFEKYGEYKYVGPVVDGLMHGDFGIYTSYTNDYVYSGNFQHGRKHGYGMFRYNNGDYYDGEFKEGNKHGDGVLFFAEFHAKVKCKFIDNYWKDLRRCLDAIVENDQAVLQELNVQFAPEYEPLKCVPLPPQELPPVSVHPNDTVARDTLQFIRSFEMMLIR